MENNKYYYVAVSRDEQRNFLYSSILSIDELAKDWPNFPKTIKKLFTESPDKDIIGYQIPSEGYILYVGRNYNCIRCFLGGIKHTLSRVDEWNAMYDAWIDLNK